MLEDDGMMIKKCDLYAHVKSFEGKEDLSGFLEFIDRPIRGAQGNKDPQ